MIFFRMKLDCHGVIQWMIVNLFLNVQLCCLSGESVLKFEKTYSATPYLEFEVIITDADDWIQENFSMDVIENHPSRLQVDLYNWAFDEYKEASDALPAFAIPHMAEVFMAR